ncbi:Electron transfer flavoprotein subunit alpha, mitochondrial Short=Alpha-ETF; Flags: Precursor [Cyberlindnera jadinii]|uniref:Probable electron transfer flavoprotein subunit alpha n=1 Tax=Cyberlindnera jadinii (strain ATCC 18201 / CBS 1600 / BCRC 20928 / JCM 3617 / NBRC 0987 / NRRL Y-1542) TaxID=983966 RepID=A0A0H5CBM5_CYBJN|nr:Electron transfer flavoprotein subunit alpha, mitochondrial Short=Alpha-ETF; Flags: Precursor [Cyberlindnera jadinii]
MFSVTRSQFVRSLAAKRFGSTLAFVEANGSEISSASLSALNAAKQLGNPVVAVLLGSGSKSAASQLNKVEGLSKILVSEDSQFDHQLPEYIAPAISQLISNNDYSHFVTSATAVGKNVLPRVGALLDVQPVNDIIKVEDPTTFKRPIYAGNAIVTVKSNDAKILLSTRSTAFEAVPLTASESYPKNSPVEWVSENLVKSERPELTSAKIVVSGGRGLKSKENFDKYIFPLADALHAGVGATRAAVDAGYVDNSLQVGQTGKVVAPDLYIAVGISGAIQHLAGMKDSKTIVAINKDEEAPIFNVADLGLVGDLFEVVPELTEKVKA